VKERDDHPEKRGREGDRRAESVRLPLPEASLGRLLSDVRFFGYRRRGKARGAARSAARLPPEGVASQGRRREGERRVGEGGDETPSCLDCTIESDRPRPPQFGADLAALEFAA